MQIRGFHIIWTTYMTWLPGDRRGHWSPLFDMYGRLKQTGHKLNPPDAKSVDHAKAFAVDPPKILSPGERVVVAYELSQHVQWPEPLTTPGKPGAKCHAVAIEDNHVHLLLSSVREDVGKYVGRLKGRTASMVKQLPANADRKHIWTAGYWKVYLYDDEAICAVKQYIEQHNTRNGRPANPYDWITPI